MQQVLMLCGFSVLLAAGQILFKYAAITNDHVGNLKGLLTLATNRYFALAVLVYALTTVLWVVVLQKVPLSRAYPFAALGFVLVPAAGAALFGEPITLWYVLGAILIVSGIVLASWSTTGS